MKDRYLEISNVASAHLYFNMAAAPASANTTRTFCTKMHVVTTTMTEAVYSRTGCTSSLEFDTLCNRRLAFWLFLPERMLNWQRLICKEVHDGMLPWQLNNWVSPFRNNIRAQRYSPSNKVTSNQTQTSEMQREAERDRDRAVTYVAPCCFIRRDLKELEAANQAPTCATRKTIIPQNCWASLCTDFRDTHTLQASTSQRIPRL